MLGGTHSCTMDSKGRLNFPVRLREELGDRFVIAKALIDPCLTVYPMEEWDKLVEKIGTLPIGQGRTIRRHLFASMVEVTPDKQGRISLPQELIAFAQLEKQVTVLGVSNCCEIWNRERWLEEIAIQEAGPMAETILALGL